MPVSQEQLSAVNLVNLIELLQKLDTQSSAKADNSKSIDDNNGGRIIL